MGSSHEDEGLSVQFQRVDDTVTVIESLCKYGCGLQLVSRLRGVEADVEHADAAAGLVRHTGCCCRRCADPIPQLIVAAPGNIFGFRINDLNCLNALNGLNIRTPLALSPPNFCSRY